MQIAKFSILLFSLVLAIAAPAQNLLEDGRRLLHALETLENNARTPEARDSAVWEVLLILALYDDPAPLHTAGASLDTSRLLRNVNANPLLRDLLSARFMDSLRLAAPITLETDFAGMRTQGRKRIETLMYSGAPLSPSQFLSVQKSLQNSQVPPLQAPAAMRSAAQNLNAPRPVTAMGAEALLEGLFNFILERAQQEVAVNFFENLLNKRIPQVGWLFPNVRERYLNPEAGYSQSFLESLREAFFLDLKNLNLTLPELLLKDEYFGALQRDPVFFNLMTVYTIFGLSNQGIPILESVPLTHRNLHSRYQDAGKTLNIHLADTAFTATSEYIQVQAAARAYVEQMQRIAGELLDIQNACESRINRLQAQRERQTPPRPVFPVNPLYDYQVLTGRSDSEAAFHLGLLPELLHGALADSTLIRTNTLESYDKFFAVPYSGPEMRSAGLELSRRLVNGSWYNDLSQAEILRRWQADLAAFSMAIDRWELSFDTISLEQRFEETETRRGNLAGLITEMRNYWTGNSDPADLQPLVLLEAIAGDFDDIILLDETYQDSVKMLAEREDKIIQVERRIAVVEQRMASKNRAASFGSPFQKYLLREDEAKPIDKVPGQIEKLQELSATLRSALHQLDTTHAPEAHDAWLVSRPMLQVTDFLSNVFYTLQDSDGRGLISPIQFDSILFDPRLRAACLGLMQQRIGRVKDVGLLSPEALAQFTQLTLNDFFVLKKANVNLAPGEKPDSMHLFNVVTLGLQTINRVLEFPLFPDPVKPQTFVSLTQKYPALQYVPDISERCMNFLYYLETRQYRPAVSSMVRLLTSLSKQLNFIEKGKRQKAGITTADNRKTLFSFFETYGDFIAGLVDARTKDEVEFLLKSLADPPGSSRTKRNHRVTAGINAYLGFSTGLETWTRDQSGQSLRSEQLLLAPAMPVGFTISKLFFTNTNHPQSFSLHLTALDLGAMLTYRLAKEDEFGAHKFSFKNAFKPGFQLQWNIQNSPYYLGAGWQTGAQYREGSSGEMVLRSSRAFISFGIDVPVRTLYAK